MNEKCSVIVVTRDRFSTTEGCLDAVLSHTAGEHKVLLVTGGAPAKLKARWSARYAGKATLIFEPNFLNPAQARNRGLREVKTELAVLMDNDVQVRSGWLEPMVRCLRETGSAMVVPIVLEEPKKIHTAGNDLYITYEKGRKWAVKTLRLAKKPYIDGSNLERRPTDYGELHCQLVNVAIARELGVYDENLREVGEVDSGLTWRENGHKLWFEPSSVVYYEPPKRIYAVEDIRLYEWRWDFKAILAGYRYFEKKWGMDITEYRAFKFFLADFHRALGLLPRIWPCRPALWLDHRFSDLRMAVERSLKLWNRLKCGLMGFNEWVRYESRP